MEKPWEVLDSKISDKDVLDESNRRAAKAGYCTRNGDPPGRTKIMVTSGFGKTKLNIWPRDPVTGELID